MKNLKELVRIKSDSTENEIIRYLENLLLDKVEEIKVIENKQDNKKSILVGVNTKLKKLCPHRFVWTLRYC